MANERMYLVKTTEGEEMGPADQETLVKWAENGKIRPDDKIRSTMIAKWDRAINYDFLKQHEDELKILKYGYRLKQEAFSEQIVTDSMESVAERVIRGVKEENRPFDAVIQGVDDPWDVCLMQFFWLHTKASVAHNMEDFKNAGMFK